VGSAPRDPSRLRRRVRYDQHVRDVWTLRYIETNCTAAIWKNDFGLELRVEHGGELIESRLSRYGIEPLLLIADQIKANLIAQGWFDPQRDALMYRVTWRHWPAMAHRIGQTKQRESVTVRRQQLLAGALIRDSRFVL
jgi:hypothetical protein